MGRRRATGKSKDSRVARLRAANATLGRALGHTLGLLDTLLQVESWEAFEKKRDEIEPVLGKLFGQMGQPLFGAQHDVPLREGELGTQHDVPLREGELGAQHVTPLQEGG